MVVGCRRRGRSKFLMHDNKRHGTNAEAEAQAGAAIEEKRRVVIDVPDEIR